MPLFPFFVNIEGKQGLIIGGGKHALEKIQRLKPFQPRLRIFSQTYLPEIEADEELELLYRAFLPSDLDELPDFVIAAGEDAEENHKIAELCREKRILVNVVDDQEYCDFVFPSFITHGNLTVGICTNGASPATGVLLKRKIKTQIPDRMEDILDFLQEKRPMIAKTLTDKKQRFTVYYELAEICMSENRPLTEEEFRRYLLCHAQSAKKKFQESKA